MNAFLLQYLPILVFMGIAAVIGSAFLVAAFTLAPRDPDPEKNFGLRVRVQRV